MTYLTRPVFTWSIDWSEAINRSITYDLRETSLGFGAEFFLPTATYTAQGWQFSIMLTADTDITAVNTFTTALYGRVNGFWLPVPFEAFDIVAGISATQFKINSINLTQTWQDRPDIQLAFIAPNGTMQCAAISGVVANNDGTETVTIGTALNPAPGVGTTVRKLQYVRLAADAEEGTFEAESWLERPFNVIELPLEYTNIETGRQPIYLYTFTAAAPMLLTWTYTSFAAQVYSKNVAFAPFAMTHGAIQQTCRGDKDNVEIEAKSDPTHPFALFFPTPFPGTLNVTIAQCMLATPNNTTVIFQGIVRVVDDQGVKYVAECSSALYLLDRKLPRMLIQPYCNYTLFDAKTCGKQRADYEITVIIDAINNDPVNGPSVVCHLAFNDIFPGRTSTANWFAQGIFETGYSANYEPRTILSSSWNVGAAQLTLTLNLPLVRAQVGHQCQITAGCDGQASTCTQKFNNYARFGGHPAVPQRNLTLEAFNNLPVSQGGKK